MPRGAAAAGCQWDALDSSPPRGTEAVASASRSRTPGRTERRRPLWNSPCRTKAAPGLPRHRPETQSQGLVAAGAGISSYRRFQVPELRSAVLHSLSSLRIKAGLSTAGRKSRR